MKKTTLGFCLALVAGSCLMTGCASTGGDSVIVIQDGQPGKIADRNLDTEDFRVKGEEMADSLLASEVLDKAAHRPAVIAIVPIVSNANIYVDTDLLMKKICIRLRGKAIVDTTGGVLNPLDFTFSGKIIDNYVAAVKQHTYTFQLSLTDRRGLAVWEEEKEVTKCPPSRSIIGR